MPFPRLIINKINKVQWVDIKLENVLVSLHSLKTMGLDILLYVGYIMNTTDWFECHTIYFFNNTIIVQVRYIIIETKEFDRIGYNGFLFPHEYSGEGQSA
jgi:hypothetical protein